MAFKETKRKGFNFFRSYYDVFNELPEKDKLPFLTALLDRQFLGTKPTNLKGMAKFAWISQVNSIDSQVKGFEDKTGIKLTPTVGGVQRVENTPTEQVEEKEEVEVKEKVKEKVTKEDRKKDFEKDLIPFIDDYKKEMIREFSDYWTEYGINDKKLRFEKQSSFSISRRLKKWHDSEYNKHKNKSNEPRKKEKIAF